SLTLLPPPPTSTLFPYTTLFRSLAEDHDSIPPRVRGRMLTSAAIRVSSLPSLLRILRAPCSVRPQVNPGRDPALSSTQTGTPSRSEEHTSELQSRSDLVCRLLLE